MLSMVFKVVEPDFEIAEHGPARAKELRPAQPTVVIAEYEKDVDHAGLIRSLDGKAFQRGEAIYARVCGNCHGTKDNPGSMPTSLRFATACGMSDLLRLDLVLNDFVAGAMTSGEIKVRSDGPPWRPPRPRS